MPCRPCFVGKPRVIEQVRRPRQYPVGDAIRQGHRYRPPEKTGTVDDVGLAVYYRLQNARVIVGIVFQVAILDQDDIAGSQRDSRADRCTFAGVGRRAMAAMAPARACSPRICAVPSVEPSSMTMISWCSRRAAARCRTRSSTWGTCGIRYRRG